MTANKLPYKTSSAPIAAILLAVLSGCATSENESLATTTDTFVPIRSSSDATFLAVPSAPNDPSTFSADLISSMGSTVGECGPEAQTSAHVSWTCAPFTQGLDSFMKSWDTVAGSAFFSKIHDYKPLSDWMYFEIDGEIDFYWKTYELESTQALVTYDPSETGSELIVGLHAKIADQIALAKGSHKLTDEALSLPVQR